MVATIIELFWSNTPMQPISRQIALNLHGLSLRQRLGFGLASLILPLLLLAFSGYVLFDYALDAVDESYKEVDQRFIPVTTLQETLLRAVMPPNDYLVHGDPDERRNFQMLRNEVDEGFERALESAFGDQRKNDDILKARLLWTEASQIGEKILSIENPQGNTSGAKLMEKMDGLVDDVYDHLEYVCSATVAELKSKHNMLHGLYLKVGIVIMVFVVLVTIVVLIGSSMIKRWIIAPLSELENGAQKFAAGHFEYRISVQSKDEIGSVARTFNEMASALKRDRDILRNLSIHDQLTGLLNRKEFQRLLELEIARSQRHARVLALLMIDVDYFKTVNDRYGHPAGDVVLRNIADRLFTALRPNDVVARYGGEEFIVMLPETDSVGAAAIAERLCAEMRATPINIAECIQPVVTISVGIATYPFDTDMTERLVAAADQALYTAKSAGRDRCCLYAEIPTAKS